MKQAQNQEAERKACEIRIRAERRAGEILRDMEKAKGVLRRGQELPRSHNETTERPKTLSDLGINKTQSSRYQALAPRLPPLAMIQIWIMAQIWAIH